MKELLLDILFPEHLACHLCNEEAIVDPLGVCEECMVEMRPCSQLPKVVGIQEICAGYIYNDVFEQAVARFKYHNAIYLSSFFAELIRIPEGWGIDCIVPVPLHERKQKQRGYNQSELIARHCAQRFNIPLRTDILKRVVDTPSQTRMSRKERQKSVRDAFCASPIEGVSILLIDDIVTTGSTLRACAKTLNEAGAAAIFAATCLARL